MGTAVYALVAAAAAAAVGAAVLLFVVRRRPSPPPAAVVAALVQLPPALAAAVAATAAAAAEGTGGEWSAAVLGAALAAAVGAVAVSAGVGALLPPGPAGAQPRSNRVAAKPGSPRRRSGSRAASARDGELVSPDGGALRVSVARPYDRMDSPGGDSPLHPRLPTMYRYHSAFDNQKEDELRGLFRGYDTDQSGTIDMAELSAMLKDLGITDISDAKIAAIFAEVDMDDSGTVEFSEFVHFYQMLTHSLRDMQSAPGGAVAFVFTDIASSTALWELLADDMDTALTTHNDIMRQSIRANSGYEVKTIGDAFMVAFTCAQDGAAFCLQAQRDLNDAEWPSALDDVMQAKAVDVDGRRVFAGLRVRMGLHFGEVIKELNPLTRRADYRGSAVNIAARVEGQGVPGQIFLTDAAIQMIDVADLGEPETRCLGKRELKGVTGMVELHAMVPKDLFPRFKICDAAAAQEPQPNQRVMSTDELQVPVSDMEVRGGTGGGAMTVERTRTRKLYEQQLPGLGKRLGMKLRRTAATAALLAPCFPRAPDIGGLGAPDPGEVLDELCDLLRVAVEAAEQARGLFEAAHGDEMTFGWNMTRACVPHTQQGCRFAALLHFRRQPICSDDLGFAEAFGVQASIDAGDRAPRLQHHVGIATGRTLSGTVGTARQCFRTVFGRSVRVASACADHCAFLQTKAVVSRGATAGNAPGNIDTFLRPVDVWRTSDGTLLPIEEIDVVSISAAEAAFGVWDFLAEAESAGMGGGEAVSHLGTQRKKVHRNSKQISLAQYKSLFAASMSGSTTALQALRDMVRERVRDDGSCADPVLATVTDLLAAHQTCFPRGRAHRCELPRLYRSGEDEARMMTVMSRASMTAHGQPASPPVRNDPVFSTGGPPPLAHSTLAASRSARHGVSPKAQKTPSSRKASGADLGAQSQKSPRSPKGAPGNSPRVEAKCDMPLLNS